MYQFEKLPQLVDMRGKLKTKGKYQNLGDKSKRVRVWHHSLTQKDLKGSQASAFAEYHTSLGWPGCGYQFVIEPQNIIKCPDGRERARIVWANDIGAKSYHVGNSNSFCIGICVAGDYRKDKLDEATLRSISELHACLDADKIGLEDKSHNQMPGYSWKECCVFDYMMAIKYKAPAPPITVKKPDPLPGEYVIQEGDTYWSIAGRDGAQGVQVEDLIAANPGVDPAKLKVGQVIKLGKAQNAYTRKPEQPKKPQIEYKYPLTGTILKRGNRGPDVKELQRALNAVLFKCGEPDGVFGAKMEDALRRFQKVYLPYQVDGIFGPDTRNKLKAVLKSKGF